MSKLPSKNSKKVHHFDVKQMFLIVDNSVNTNNSFDPVKSNDDTDMKYYIFF
jgi:hypothetical protein